MRLECPNCLDFTSHYKDTDTGEWVCAVCGGSQEAPPEVFDGPGNKEILEH